MADYDRAEFTAWLTESCERQGVPLTITDPSVITQVATLLRGAHGNLGAAATRLARNRQAVQQNSLQAATDVRLKSVSVQCSA